MEMVSTLSLRSSVLNRGRPETRATSPPCPVHGAGFVERSIGIRSRPRAPWCGFPGDGGGAASTGGEHWAWPRRDAAHSWRPLGPTLDLRLRSVEVRNAAGVTAALGGLCRPGHLGCRRAASSPSRPRAQTMPAGAGRPLSRCRSQWTWGRSGRRGRLGRGRGGIRTSTWVR